MCRVVLIAEGVYHPGVNNIDDIVSAHDTGDELGSAYSTFKIVDIPEISKDDFVALVNEATPEIECLVDEGICKWKDALGQWYEVKARPSYFVGLDSSPASLSLLASATDDTERTNVIKSLLAERISQNPANKETEVNAS